MLIFRVPIDDTRMDKFTATLYPDDSEHTVVKTIGYEPREPGVYQTVDDGWWGIASEDQDRMVQESQGVSWTVPPSALPLRIGASPCTVGSYVRRLDAVAAGRDPLGVLREPGDDVIVGFDASFHLVPELAL